jgi:surface antigen
VEAAQKDLTDTQNQIAKVQKQINATNAKLAPVSKHLFSVATQIHKEQQQLFDVLVTLYKARSASISFQDDSTLPTSDDINSLTDALASDQQDAQSLQRQVDQQLGPVNSAMASLASLYQLEKSQRDVYESHAAQLDGQAKDINAQIDKARYQIQALQWGDAGDGSNSGGWVAQGGIAPFGLGSRFDAFPWGQCTWYVASLRDVTWWGDAWMWAGNAAAAGYPEGMTPRVGSIVVWGPGHGYSGYGHVAYVAAVNGPSDFVVNEANYLGLGIVSERHITTLNDVEAFIY